MVVTRVISVPLVWFSLMLMISMKTALLGHLAGPVWLEDAREGKSQGLKWERERSRDASYAG